MDRYDWLEQRRTGIGGSDIAAIMGWCPQWRNALNVYADKVGCSDDEHDNEAMEWGRILEDVIRRKFAEEHPEFAVQPSPPMMRGEKPYYIANVDGLLFDVDAGGFASAPPVAVWECKTVNGATFSRYWRGDDGAVDVPIYVEAQVQWYMSIVGVERAWVSVLVDGREYHEIVVERNPEMFSMMAKKADAFWHDNVLAGEPPIPDGSDESRKALEAIYDSPVEDEEPVEIESVELLYERERIVEEMRALEERKSEIDNALRNTLREHTVGVTGEWIVSWKPSKRVTIDTKAFMRELPDVAVRFTRETTFRVLRVTKRGE